MRKDLKKIYEANMHDFGGLEPAKIMAVTLWAESRGEPLSGKVAVGTVILNRVVHRAWDGDTLTEVCLWPRQFSCFNPDDPQRVRLVKFAADFDAAIEADKRLADCYVLAQGMMAGVIRPDAEIRAAKCCQYLTTAAKAWTGWWRSMRFVKKIGGHEFYTEVG